MVGVDGRNVTEIDPAKKESPFFWLVTFAAVHSSCICLAKRNREFIKFIV